MTLWDIILLSVGLAMDSFSVSVVEGIRFRSDRFRMPRIIVFMIVVFGVFQGGMPLIGYYAGQIAASFFSKYAGWVALVLLSGIGTKMIIDSRQEESPNTGLSMGQILLLAVATSIDAAVSGLLFVPVPELLWKSLAIIALTSSLFSLIGYVAGYTIGKLPFNAELAGGIILILIGVKICFVS